MLNIVIPMAGKGSRFTDAGYRNPKPFIDVFGEPMIKVVSRNVAPKCEHRFIYICQKDHLENENWKMHLETASESAVIIPIDYVTEGAACTVLLAEEYIDSGEPLLIANSDQYVDTDIDAFIASCGRSDGGIMCMPASDPKWSFIRYDDEGNVTDVKEKEVISNMATVGIYFFAHGSDFVKYAHQMIEKELRVNGEFYVAPVYNEMIAERKKISYFDIGEKMYGLGTPEDLEVFLKKYGEIF